MATLDIATLLKLAMLSLLLVISCYFIIYKMALCLVERERIKKRGKAARAVVLQHNTLSDAEGVTFYHPVLEFTTGDGRTVQVEYDEGFSSEHDRPVGKQYEIYYLPGEPQKVVFAQSYPIAQWIGIVFGLTAVVLLVWEGMRIATGTAA
ncbi:MAG TPA: DUF3592 domain-containing protein [Chitinophagaceae bacterium]